MRAPELAARQRRRLHGRHDRPRVGQADRPARSPLPLYRARSRTPSTVDPNNAIFEADETNNSATQTTTVVTGIDLTVWKGDNGHGTPPDDPPGAAPPLTQGFDPIATNGTDTYTIIVGDVGTQNATGVTVRDTLPAGTKFLSVTSDHGFTCSHRTAPRQAAT